MGLCNCYINSYGPYFLTMFHNSWNDDKFNAYTERALLLWKMLSLKMYFYPTLIMDL